MMNSKSGFLKLSWKRVWIAGSIFFILGIGVCEGVLRSRGYQPSLFNDASVWSWWRSQAEGASTDTLAVVGTSRIQSGFDPSVWKEIFPGQHRIVILANAGFSPVTALEDLAGDLSFKGLVLCEVNVFSLSMYRMVLQDRWVTHYHKQFNFFERWMVFLRSYFQEFLVMADPALFLQGAMAMGVSQEQRKNGARHLKMFPDRRIRFLDEKRYASMSPDKFIWSAGKIQEAVSREEIRSGVQRMENAAQRIRGRGGKVVFIEYPNEAEKRVRNYFFDTLDLFISSPCIYYDDYEGLRDFVTRDGSHLQSGDVPEFTRRLAGLIKDKGWF